MHQIASSFGGYKIHVLGASRHLPMRRNLGRIIPVHPRRRCYQRRLRREFAIAEFVKPNSRGDQTSQGSFAPIHPAKLRVSSCNASTLRRG
jgi:hypothetical protein